MKYQNLYHVIDISCNTCERQSTVDLFSLDYGYRPFIVVNTTSSQTIKRQRRSINCSAGISECCRDKLFISFAEIGWNDWILHPAGYDAYFCRGSCASVATITSNYHLFVRVSWNARIYLSFSFYSLFDQMLLFGHVFFVLLRFVLANKLFYTRAISHLILFWYFSLRAIVFLYCTLPLALQLQIIPNNRYWLTHSKYFFSISVDRSNKKYELTGRFNFSKKKPSVLVNALKHFQTRIFVKIRLLIWITYLACTSFWWWRDREHRYIDWLKKLNSPICIHFCWFVCFFSFIFLCHLFFSKLRVPAILLHMFGWRLVLENPMTFHPNIHVYIWL